MIKDKQLATIKKILTDLKDSEKCCGACGQVFHRAIFCDAADELDIVSEKLTNLINNTERYLLTKSSVFFDDEGYKNHLRGEVSGYKIALDLIKAAK